MFARCPARCPTRCPAEESDVCGNIVLDGDRECIFHLKSGDDEQRAERWERYKEACRLDWDSEESVKKRRIQNDIRFEQEMKNNPRYDIEVLEDQFVCGIFDSLETIDEFRDILNKDGTITLKGKTYRVGLVEIP